MKKIKLFLLLLTPLLFGCATVTQTLYLQDVEVSGPINHPPIHITSGKEKSSFTISPKLYFNTANVTYAQRNHSKVNSFGVYQIDTLFENNGTWRYKESNANNLNYKGRNFKWNLPDFYAGFDFDLSVSQSVAIAGGINVATQNQRNLFGGSLGLGFFKENPENAIRFDIGVTIQEFYYDASTVVITTTDPVFGTPTTDVSFFHDINKNTDINFYASLTYNSSFKEIPVNFFIGLSYFGQTLLNFEPDEPNPNYYSLVTTVVSDARGEASTSFISASPGIYINLSEWTRVAFGISILRDIQMEEASKSLFILPVVKFDMLF